MYLQGATGEIAAVQQALAADPACLAGVELVSVLIPGMNGFDYVALHPEARLTTFMANPALAVSLSDGRTHVLPLNYGRIAAWLRAQTFDLALLTVTPPQDSRLSFGACADFGPLIRARRRIGLVNTAAPRPVTAPSAPLEAFEALCAVHEPLAFEAPAPSPLLARIAGRIAALIPDGASVQTGIGGAPGALWPALHGHRDLRLHSGLVSQAFFDALDAGAAAASGHLAGTAFGGPRLAERIDRSDVVAFADVGVTHDLAALAARPRFIAVNGALEIDLYGQVNAEWRGGRAVSGAGGSPDFARAAMASPGGRSILALPATAAGGAVSRITPRLQTPATLSRFEVDTVVTEHGAAIIRDLPTEARAQALIAVAAPEHRDALQAGWRALQA